MRNKLLTILVLLFMIPQSFIYPTQHIPKTLIKNIQKQLNEHWLSSLVYDRLISSIDQFEKRSKAGQYDQMNEEQLESFTNFIVGLAILGSPKTDQVKNDKLWKDIENLYTDCDKENTISCIFKCKHYYPDEKKYFSSKAKASFVMQQCSFNFKFLYKGVPTTICQKVIEKEKEIIVDTYKKAEEFVVEHKEEVLVGIGIIAGIIVGTVIACKIVSENNSPPSACSQNNTANVNIDNSITSAQIDQNIQPKENQLQNDFSSLFFNVNSENKISDNQLSPTDQNHISFLLDSMAEKLTNIQLYSNANNVQNSQLVEQNNDISRDIGYEIAHTILDIAAITGEGIKDTASLVVHKILGGAEEGINLINLLGKEFQKELDNIGGLIPLTLDQDPNLEIDSKNNQILKDAFALAHNKVDEFFYTDLADYYNKGGAAIEVATGYIPFFPPAEGTVIAGQVLETFKTIEQESALAEDLSLSAKEISRIEGEVIDNTINGFAKENLVNTQNKIFVEYSDIWHKGTFNSAIDSMEYHLAKHGNGRTIEQYTNDAMNFYNKNKHLGKEVQLKDGSFGIKIETISGNNKVGGYWTNDGKIVTFWD